MNISYYHVDAFTSELFHGNPACVIPLDSWLPDDVMLNIAKENGVAESAFFIFGNDEIFLRWFTPDIEMDLCGHATLSAAHIIASVYHYDKPTILFKTASGDVSVKVDNDQYTLDFPSREPVPSDLPQSIMDSLNYKPKEVLQARDYVLVYDTEQQIRDIRIDRNLFDMVNLDPGGIVITAQGDNCDFVSRFFTPQATLFEDPVTGSAHCSLIPYWSKRLNKRVMNALQLSNRVGQLSCIDMEDRVMIGGKAVTFSSGVINI